MRLPPTSTRTPSVRPSVNVCCQAWPAMRPSSRMRLGGGGLALWVRANGIKVRRRGNRRPFTRLGEEMLAAESGNVSAATGPHTRPPRSLVGAGLSANEVPLSRRSARGQPVLSGRSARGQRTAPGRKGDGCAAGHHRPERGADAEQLQARQADQEGQDGRVAVGLVLQRRGQRAGDGAQQRQPGDRHHQLAREGRQQHRDAAARQAQQHVIDAGGHRRGVAPRRVFVGLAAHADGRGDGGEVEGIAAERREQRRRDAGDGDAGRYRRAVAAGTLGRHAGQVLRGHRHEEQWQRHADQGLPAEHRRRPLRQHEDLAGVDAGQMQPTLDRGGHQAGQQHARHRIARPPPSPGQVGQRHRHDQAGRGLHAGGGVEPEAGQHAGQQGRGDRDGQAVHQLLEHPTGTGRKDQQPADDEGADGLGQGQAAGRREQRRARRGPGGQDGLAGPQAQAQAGQSHAEAQGPQPGGGLRRRGPERHRGLEDDRHRAGVAHQHRDKAGDQRGGREVLQGRAHRASIAAGFSGAPTDNPTTTRRPRPAPRRRPPRRPSHRPRWTTAHRRCWPRTARAATGRRAHAPSAARAARVCAAR
mmetsp:Transcript_21599/g.51230  ORF Transcript_21599/g.51230 Transcript_21599/m.51230 type:complete len:586 (-) Transcript_21599:1687-3444(-)